jgi:hypothetical protein
MTLLLSVAGPRSPKSTMPLTDSCVIFYQSPTAKNRTDTWTCQLVEFGKEILKIIPGRVSTEVDARFSFDKEANINKVDISCSVSLLAISTLTRDHLAGQAPYFALRVSGHL